MALQPRAGGRTVFVSHSSSDRGIAAKIVSEMERAGVRGWIDTRELDPGDELDGTLEEAIRTARCVIVVLSSASVDSEWVRKEIRWARKYRKKIVPVKAGVCTIPPEIANRLVYCDLSNLETADGEWRRLIRIVATPRRQPSLLTLIVRGCAALLLALPWAATFASPQPTKENNAEALEVPSDIAPPAKLSGRVLVGINGPATTGSIEVLSCPPLAADLSTEHNGQFDVSLQTCGARATRPLLVRVVLPVGTYQASVAPNRPALIELPSFALGDSETSLESEPLHEIWPAPRGHKPVNFGDRLWLPVTHLGPRVGIAVPTGSVPKPPTLQTWEEADSLLTSEGLENPLLLREKSLRLPRYRSTIANDIVAKAQSRAQNVTNCRALADALMILSKLTRYRLSHGNASRLRRSISAARRVQHCPR